MKRDEKGFCYIRKPSCIKMSFIKLFGEFLTGVSINNPPANEQCLKRLLGEIPDDVLRYQLIDSRRYNQKINTTRFCALCN